MADRAAAKHRRLNEFRRRLPFISASGLSALLQDIEEHGAPKLASRRSMARATEEELRQETPYGSLLTELELVSTANTVTKILAINPLGYLAIAYEAGGSFTDLFDKTHAANPSSPEHPWRICLYGDEVTPGNPVAVVNDRKVWVIYFSFLELGCVALSAEELWFTGLVCRTSVVGEISSGISQVYGGFLKLFFGTLGADLSAGGIVFRNRNGGLVRLFADLGMVLQDGGAHKLVWSCKAI